MNPQSLQLYVRALIMTALNKETAMQRPIKFRAWELGLFALALRLMKPRQKLYELVKAEVKRRGHWKNLPRGRHARR